MVSVGGIDENTDAGRVENILAAWSGVYLTHAEAPEVVAVTVANVDDGAGSQQRDQRQQCEVRNYDDGTNAAGARRQVVLAAMDSTERRGHSCQRRDNED